MKSTKVYLNGNYYRVDQPSNNETVTIYSLTAGRAVRVAGGETLFDATKNFDEGRYSQDDIFKAFETAYAKQLQAIQHLEDEEKYNDLVQELWYEYMNNISGEDYFEIVRDSTYNNYVNWDYVEEEEED